jgi:hypothetical protein
VVGGVGSRNSGSGERGWEQRVVGRVAGEWRAGGKNNRVCGIGEGMDRGLWVVSGVCRSGSSREWSSCVRGGLSGSAERFFFFFLINFKNFLYNIFF